MERTLSLVLDEQGLISLTLIKAEADDIDKFTTKKFEDSEQIREYYKEKIAPYLEENKNYIEEVEKQTGKKFRGRIVLLEAHEYNEELTLLERRVLYKKHLLAFKEIVKDRLAMRRFVNMERRGVTEYGYRKLSSAFLVREIKCADFRIQTRVDLIMREIKKSRNFYDILRIIIKAYELERKNRPQLRTIEAIYKEKQKQPKIQSPKKVYEIEDDKNFNIGGFRYSYDDIPFDIDDLRRMDTDFIPDGLGDKDERIR